MSIKTEINKLLATYNKGYHEHNPIASLCKDLEESAQSPVTNTDELFCNCYCGYEQTLRVTLETDKYFIQVALYRMALGTYECTAYISHQRSSFSG